MLLAMHISDGVLAAPWSAGGFALTAALLWLATYRLRDEEIPRIALLTAAFFIASSIHVRLGTTSVHLLLTGLVGALLGVRSTLAITVGLLLQCALLGHGGYQALGVNACVQTLPALLCGALFRRLHQVRWLLTPSGRAVLVGGAALLWFFGAAYSVVLFRDRVFSTQDDIDWPLIHAQVFQPWVLCFAVVLAAAAIWLERRVENAPEFPLGLLIGLLAVLLAVGLNYFVLSAGAREPEQVPTLVFVLLHLPVAVIEGIVLGFAVGFLARVKPELLTRPSDPIHRFATRTPRETMSQSPTQVS